MRRSRLLSLILGVAIVAGAMTYIVWPKTEPKIDETEPPIEIVWTFSPLEHGAFASSPTVDGETIYLSAIHYCGKGLAGAVYAVDVPTGEQRWMYNDDGRMLASVSSPAIHDGKLYVGEGMHANFRCKLRCIDTTSGTLIWDFTANGHIESGPIVEDGMVIFAAGDDGVYALNNQDGEIIWHFKDEVHIDCDPTWYEGDVYVGSGPSRKLKRLEVLRLAGKTGNVVWRTPVELPAWSSPAVDGEQVIVGLGNGRMTTAAKEPAGAVLCLDRATGEKLWQNNYPDAVFQKPQRFWDAVSFGCRDGWIRMVHLNDGNEKFQRDLGSPIIAPPDWDYVLTQDGTLHDIGGADPPGWSFDIAQRMQSKVVATASMKWSGRKMLVACELIQGPNRFATLFCFAASR